MNNSNSIWFKDINNNLSFEKESLRLVVKYIFSTLVKKRKSHDSLPSEIVGDNSPRVVLISVSDAKNRAKVFVGASEGILSAVNQAIDKISTRNLKDICWVKVDFVDECNNNVKLTADKIKTLKNDLFGVANNNVRDIAILNEEIVSNQLFNDDGELNIDNWIKYSEYKLDLFRHGLMTDTYSWTLFTTKSFFTDGDSVTDLYRGHPCNFKSIKDEIKSSLKQAGMYLMREMDSTGKFNYGYNIAKDSKLPGYNIIRHCGAVCSLFEFYEFKKDKKVLDAASLGVKYIASLVQPITLDNVKASCLVESNTTKLGGNGLALLVLAKYTRLTKDYQYKEIMENLAKWIKYAQDSNGDFTIYKQDYLTKETDSTKNDYYAGEAILGLLGLYSIDSNKEWVKLSEKAVDYIIDNLAQESIQNQHHWLMFALNELYSVAPNKKYLEHSLKIADSIIDFQVKDSPVSDLVGCFGNVPSSPAAATRTEGLAAAYKLCKKAKYDGDSQKILEAIKLGINFQLQTQYSPASVMYFNDPQRFIGSFGSDLTETVTRIDFIQHNMSSFLSSYEFIED